MLEIGPSYTYYFAVPFETTLARHTTKPVAHEYGEPKLRHWWRSGTCYRAEASS